MSPEIIKLMIQGIEETVFMVSVSTIIAAIIGIPLGITLVTTSKGHILENSAINKILGTIVNIIRSIPFIILMVAIIPLTRIIAGTSIGTTAACVPLTIRGHTLSEPSRRNIYP
jgi:D-methionine transport system permease protein